jgi:MerR family transcriptional regulator, light-induced transcriptional regulator
VSARNVQARIGAFSDRFLAALLAADRRQVAETINDVLHEGFDGVAVLDDLVAPAMRQVGWLWETGKITVVDEHVATAIVHAMLTRIYPSLKTAEPRTRGIVLLAGAEREQHVLGLRMVADVLEADGYAVRNVGAALAADPLAAAVVRHRPVLVALASTVASDPPALAASVRAVRSVAPDLPVLLGGVAAAATELDDWMELCLDVRSAPAAAARLIGRGGEPALSPTATGETPDG